MSHQSPSTLSYSLIVTTPKLTADLCLLFRFPYAIYRLLLTELLSSLFLLSFLLSLVFCRSFSFLFGLTSSADDAVDESVADAVVVGRLKVSEDEMSVCRKKKM